MSETAFLARTARKTHAFAKRAHYQEMHARALSDPEGFWAAEAMRLDWIKPFSTVKNVSWDPDNLFIKWFEDGSLNVSANCIDRHLPHRAKQTAIIWEGDDPNDSRHISYEELHREVCRLANVMKYHGVKKGDRVTIYLPMIPEAAYAMLACARIGAIHSVVFAGFSPESLAGRIRDCQSHFVVTADEGVRGGKTIPLKMNTDLALTQCPEVKTVLMVRRTGCPVLMHKWRDLDYHAEMAKASATCPPAEMNAEDPLFILYTSGSTGKPKGVLHTTGGYLMYAAFTHQHVFDYREGEVYWCTADVGWITGHSYVVYGPLANGATTVMFEGAPHYPTVSRFWEVVDKHQVNIFYTAPTALRALMREGDGPVKKTSRQSLRILGSVGEPINPQAWLWYWRTVGGERCPVVDTWWQTETGGILISPLPGVTELKPGSASRPLFGIRAELVDSEGNPLEGEASGHLVLLDSWPGQMRTVYGDHGRFVDAYFRTYPGKYFTGDGCRRDADGDYWFTGRVDDVISVSGHRIGSAEVESALVAHHSVAEAAVVAMPDDIRGQGIYAFVTLNSDVRPYKGLEDELRQWIVRQISSIARPEAIQFAPALPKTRSGKIMRRILRKIAGNDLSNLGDISTLADPAVIDDLLRNAATMGITRRTG
jgi:acetyl-CoA synthetase